MLTKEAVYHRPKNNFAYAYDKDTLHIRLQVKKNEAEIVRLIWGDPFTWDQDKDGVWKWKSEEHAEMTLLGKTELFDIWTIALKPPHKRLKYGFEIIAGGEKLIYTEQGFIEKKPEHNGGYFTFPYLNEEDIFTAPSWVKDTVWYQIFPERFANGDETLNPAGALPWGSTEPTANNTFGGDFEGVIQNIDYLVKLGVTGIYFTPIFKAFSNHKYDTIDYMEIDPQFGDKETFKRLVDICHENGIKVMLDAVFNHCGYEFPPFQDVVVNGEHSEYKDWFHINSFPLKKDGKVEYETFGFSENMPKLKTGNPEVREYLLEVGRYWVKEFGIDGWRLDVANEVSHDFWREFRKEIKAIDPEVYILGEVWHDAMPWLQGDQFDAVMNYPYTSVAIEYFAEGKVTASEFINRTSEALLMYPEQVSAVAFNLLGSHDTPRIATVCGENTAKVKQLFTFLLSSPGAPCIYYGDEIGLTGVMDPGCRKCMVWDEKEQDTDLLSFITQLISLRKTNPAFGNRGRIQFMEASAEDEVVMYTKTYEDQTILFVLNGTDRDEAARLPEKAAGGQCVLTGEKVNGLSIELKPHGIAMISY
ncbi:glycoside hydrolase family 13 protein [Metabacillus sp. SLBN-84]